MNVDVYFNLHLKLWSVKCRQSGLVICHSNFVSFNSGIHTIVRKAGRARVLLEKKKNVHAFIRGSNPNFSECTKLEESIQISYSPFREDHFTEVGSNRQVNFASSAMMRVKNSIPEVWVTL